MSFPSRWNPTRRNGDASQKLTRRDGVNNPENPAETSLRITTTIYTTITTTTTIITTVSARLFQSRVDAPAVANRRTNRAAVPSVEMYAGAVSPVDHPSGITRDPWIGRVV